MLPERLAEAAGARRGSRGEASTAGALTDGVRRHLSLRGEGLGGLRQVALAQPARAAAAAARAAAAAAAAEVHKRLNEDPLPESLASCNEASSKAGAGVGSDHCRGLCWELRTSAGLLGGLERGLAPRG
eukprot:SM000031S11596  [mRNA]  locus=s31:544480:545074:- [translate_table: standard]